MGYRSQVGYVISFDWDIDWTEHATDADKKLKGKDVFHTFITEAKANEETKLCFDEESPLEINENQLLLKFHVDDWKWYDSFDDVKCHENLLNLAEEYVEAQENNQAMQNLTISYGFVRIGEDVNDIDERYGGNDGYRLIHPFSSIEFDV